VVLPGDPQNVLGCFVFAAVLQKTPLGQVLPSKTDLPSALQPPVDVVGAARQIFFEVLAKICTQKLLEKKRRNKQI
jgi:hypothetical protein